MAVLMSSQHLHELEAIASNITFLRDGAVVYSGPMENVGADCSYNAYELGTPSNAEVLNDLFGDPRFGEPFHNGVSYVIKTSTEVAAYAVLQKLLAAGIEVTYFRDVSRSIKSLFQ